MSARLLVYGPRPQCTSNLAFSAPVPTSSTSSVRPGPGSRSHAARLSTSAPRAQEQTHYDTLGLPHSASRMEIKASYFRLSKKYHPDVSADRGAGSADKFHRVSEAYAVLSDDRQKRAYDRTLVEPRAPLAGAGVSGAAQETSRWAYEMHERRRRGATHAWEGPRGYRAHQHPHHQHPQHAQHAHRGASQPHGRPYDPFSSARSSSSASSSSASSSSSSSSSLRSQSYSYHPDSGGGRRPGPGKALSGKEEREEAERAAHDRLMAESNVGRFLRVLGIILAVSWIGGHGGGG